MHQLSPEAQQKAVDFLKEYGRPLEWALYRWHFENGSREDVYEALSAFQNPDGGFGYGLEPDIRLKDSSVIATTVAFQHLRALQAPADHPLVVNGCRYLRDTYHEAALNWAIIPPNIDDAPHAPWWAADGDMMVPLINPRVEILGYVLDYAGHFPQEMRTILASAVTVHLLSHGDAMEMHDLLCVLRLYATEALPAAAKTSLFDKLTRILVREVTRDPDAWRSYGLPPLSVIQAPESPFAPTFRDALEANLDFLIEQQEADGAWSPNWTWGDPEDAAWQQARSEWCGVLTLNNLVTLRAFGRSA